MAKPTKALLPVRGATATLHFWLSGPIAGKSSPDESRVTFRANRRTAISWLFAAIREPDESNRAATAPSGNCFTRSTKSSQRTSNAIARMPSNCPDSLRKGSTPLMTRRCESCPKGGVGDEKPVRLARLVPERTRTDVYRRGIGQGGAQQISVATDTRDIDEGGEAAERVGQRGVTSFGSRAHVRLVGKRPQHLLGGREQVLLVAGGCRCRLHEALAYRHDVAIETIHALNNANDRRRSERDQNGEKKAEAKRAATRFGRCRLCFRIPFQSDHRTAPAGQVPP